MTPGAVTAAAAQLAAAVDELRTAVTTAGPDELVEALTVCEAGTRGLDLVSVQALARAERQGVFTDHGYRGPAPALADLLRWEPRRARRHTLAAEQVTERVGIDGTVCPPALPATATVFAAAEIGLGHVEVIATLLATRAAQRIDPGRRAGAEQALAEHARHFTPTELRTWGTRLLEALDQDGPAPDDDDDESGPQINELRLARHRDRPGGTITGRFDDAAMFDAITTVLDTHAAPRDADDPRAPAERAAEALAEVCGFALAHGPATLVPDTGGRRPQLVVTVSLTELEGRARAAMLEFGGTLTASTMRMLACDAAVIPVVLGGAGQPLDIGRATRTVPDGLRRAVTARDRGCAHPGCDRPPSWCEIHHVLPWQHHGTTDVDNLVMLCRIHHRQVHHAGWTVHMIAGIPEFVPPAWIDAGRHPRRRPPPHVVVDHGGTPRPAPPVRVVSFDDLTPAGAPAPLVATGPDPGA